MLASGTPSYASQVIARWGALGLSVLLSLSACQNASPPPTETLQPRPTGAVVVVSHEGRPSTPLARCGEPCAELPTATPPSDFFQRYAATASTHTAQVANLALTTVASPVATGAASRPLMDDMPSTSGVPTHTTAVASGTAVPVTGPPPSAAAVPAGALARTDGSSARAAGSVLGPFSALLDVPRVTSVASATPPRPGGPGTGTPAPTFQPTITSTPTATIGPPSRPSRPVVSGR